MSADTFGLVVLQLGLMLACGLGCGYAMKLLKQPPVLGEMIGGLLLGPTILGTIAPSAQAWLFPAFGNSATIREAAIKLGMLFFLFVVGLEIQVSQLFKFGWTALLVGTIGTLVPLGCGAALVYAVPDIWGPQADNNRLTFALFIGASMANSANPVLARILFDLGVLKKNIGAVLMTATVVDDLVGWSLLAVIFADFAQPEGTVAASAWSRAGGVALVIVFFAGMLVIGGRLGPALLRYTQRRVTSAGGDLGVVVVMILASACASEWIGIHAFLGPFVLGMALAGTAGQRRETYEIIQQFASGFFVPVYFVSMGLNANFIGSFDALLVALVVAVAFLSKLSSVSVAARISGMDMRTSLAIGFGMNARGATGIILATLGLQQGVINEATYVSLVIMCLVTSIAAGPMMKVLLDRSPLLATGAAKAAVASA